MSTSPDRARAGAIVKAAEAHAYFTADTEIIALNAGQVLQTYQSVGGVARPGIYPPIGESLINTGLAGPYMPDDSSWGYVTSIIKRGCYIRLDEHSGFPFIYMRDFLWDKWWGRADTGGEASMADPRHDGRQVKITKRWTRIPPFQIPLLFPPTARYMQGCGSAWALYSIGGWVTDDDERYALWPIKLEVRTLDNPPNDENDKWPTEYFTTIYQRFYTGTNGGADKTLYFPAMPVIIESDADNNVTLTGSMGAHGPTNLTNILIYFFGLTYDALTQKDGRQLSITGTKMGSVNLQKDALTSRWWYLQVFANYVADPEVQGDMPAKTDIEVSM